ncbi:MAG: hypothetical protein ACLFO2_02220 [Candidatus Woesearchaeota archaeon]
MRTTTFTAALLLLLMLPLSNALLAGSTSVVEEFERCEDLYVNVTAELDIDPGEYSFVGCDKEDGTEHWHCDCHDDYSLEMSLLPNTMNNYTLDMTWYYNGEAHRRTRNKGSGGNVGPITIVPRSDDKPSANVTLPDEAEGEPGSEDGGEGEGPAAVAAPDEDADDASAGEEPSGAPQATGAVTGGDAEGLDSGWFWLFGALGFVLVLFGAYGVVKRRQR